MENPVVLTVLGARPQFIKAASVSRCIERSAVREILCHTGQHYDREMSEIFFRDLGVPTPKYELGLGGGSHGQMTARMLEGIESVVLKESPHIVLVYGDTNSTLAGVLAAAKLNVPVAHVEAGLRSFNRRMPEEINRLVADRLADLLFCSSETGASNLRHEGITEGVFVVGDVMADSLELARALKKDMACLLPPGVAGSPFGLMTLHRAENTDEVSRLRAILRGIASNSARLVFPVHPRTRKVLGRESLELPVNVTPIEPVGYLELIGLLDAADFVVTDSGGLQKEAYWCGKPCITLRDETEWTETVEAGWNVLVGADESALRAALANPPKAETHPCLYGDGRAAERVVASLVEFLN